MITREHVREWLTATPFKPFRLYMSDGSHHDIMHPEVAWVWGSRVFVGHDNGSKEGEMNSVRQLSILHLTRVEEIPKGPTRTAEK